MDVNEVRADLQLIGNRIARLNIENTFVMIDLSDENVEREIDLTYDISDKYSLSDEEEVLAANLMLHLAVKISNGYESALIELDLEGCFALENSNDEKLLEGMLPVSGCAALYSIARGIVSSVTSHMCMNGTVLIPLINTFDFVDKTNE